MAKITSWSGDSPHAREVVALERLKRELPSDWFGYANVFVKDARKDAGQEVDLILVCDDRIIMIDVKDWVGTVTQGRGKWDQARPGQPPKSMGADPILKLFHANNALRSRMKAAGISPQPYVMNVVLFTRKATDFSEVAKHASKGGKGEVVDITSFISAAKTPRSFDALIGKPEFDSRPKGLTNKSGKLFQALRNFFSIGRDFSVADTSYAAYRAKDEAISKARLWTHYEASSDNAFGDVALLRLWNFDVDEGLSIDDADRETLVGRENQVQAFLRMHKTGSKASMLAFKQCFNDGGAHRWELFQNQPDNVTLESFLERDTDDVATDVRMDLLESLMAAGATLSSAMVAHRDLGEHSVWIDLERRRVSLSNLVAARIPGATTAGRNLPNLARGAILDPSKDETEILKEVDPIRSDVHAFAYAGLKILLGPAARLNLDDEIPIYAISDSVISDAGIGPALNEWFGTALETDLSTRYASCADAHSELIAALTKDRNGGSQDQLAPYRRDVPCFLDYQQHEMIAHTRPGTLEWRTNRGSGSPTRSRLWLAQSKGRDKAYLDFVRRGAALSVLPPAIAPRIIECSLDAYGPFLCVEEVVGKKLSQSVDAMSLLDCDGITTFIRKLAHALLTAHELGLSHGDFSPSNIIVVSRQHGADDTEICPQPCLVDWLDFSTEEAGPRETVDYGGNETDPLLRDRKALGQVILEIVGGCSDWTSLLAAAQAFAADEPTGDFPHWQEVSLVDVDSLLAPQCSNVEEVFYVWIGGLADGEELPGEDGGFRVLFADGLSKHYGRESTPRATLVGSGIAVVVKFDRKTHEVCSAFKKSATAGLENAAARYGERIEARLIASTTKGPETWRFLESVQGFEKLRLSEETEVEARSPSTLSPTVSSEKSIKTELTRGAVSQKISDLKMRNVIPSPLKMWEATLTAEADTWPAATALSKIGKVSSQSDLYRVEVDFGIDPSRLEDGMIIYVKDRSCGKFDKARSGEGAVAITTDRGVPSITKGDQLEFRSWGEVSNIRRRAAALMRVGTTPHISSLPNYFSANASATLGETVDAGPEPTNYGLNQPQMAALVHLWHRGPVSFLQGPPGTGKTKFIAAFVHHALTLGGAKNVLLTAQTHEAVDEAAARIVELFQERGEKIDIIRIASNADRVDMALRDSHSVALQERVREKFASERAERVACLAKPLGIAPAYVRDCAKLLKGVVATAESVEALQSAGPKVNEKLLERMQHVLERQCETLGIPLESAADPRLLRLRVLEDAAELHGVRRQDPAGLVLKLFDAANEYEEALGRRGALEPVFVRTRRLICGTCVGLGDEKLNLASQAFDLVVVDEAARAQGSELAIPLATARKALLVGDQKQLEPFLDAETIRRAAESLKIDDAELAVSDFARAFESPYGNTASAQLDIQYRMAPKIGELVSDIFYDGKLKTGRQPPKGEWDGLPWPFDEVLSWVDVAGTETYASGRVRNNAEVEDVVESLELLARSSAGNRLLSDHEACGVSEAFVGVIAMYADQVAAIRQRIANSSLDLRWREQIKIGTVDSYQGKENSIVLVSLVRDNPRGTIGFLRKENRVNVALSRAKERLVIFGARRMFERSESKLQHALSHPTLVDRIAPLKQSNLTSE